MNSKSKKKTKKLSTKQTISPASKIMKAMVLLNLCSGYIDWEKVDDSTLDWGIANPKGFAAQAKEFLHGVIKY